ncbi:hypothetical protein V6N11_078359 [Hibiscus sabdariffa]|uniref:UBX domain-containing protein n=1 Tax=Hibiscus sabdariffa TaxID=183260 RepID=A0ABR2TGN6_9ROSI
MSLQIRASVRKRGQPSCNGIFCRIVCLPRSIIGGFSRAIMGRRNQIHLQHQPLLHPVAVPEERAFLAGFEHRYGTTHPFFYCCSFMQALKMAEDDHKLMFLYLHSPEHPFTPSICSTTLCSELVVQFLDANFVSWGAIADRGEGLQMAATLQPTTFPFCAVIAPASGNSIVVLQQMEGPIDPAELVEILQRTIEEQGSAFGTSARGREQEHTNMSARINQDERIRTRAEEEAKLMADRRLRDEQDAAYFAALRRDQVCHTFGHEHLYSDMNIDKQEQSNPFSLQEKEQLRNARAQKPVEASNQTSYEKQPGKPRQSSSVRESRSKETTAQGKDTHTQILIRFPSGATRKQSFSSTDKILSVYQYIDSLVLK